MSSPKHGPFSSLTHAFQQIFGEPSVKPRRKPSARRGRFESLESRQLMVADLAAISGLVYRDVTGNGYNAGEEVSGAGVQLYRDNGDGLFNAANDTLVNTKSTNSAGNYRFDGLTAGNYFVQQQAIAVGSKTLPAKTSGMINISAADAQGTMYTIIDTFDTTQQFARANSQTKANSSSVVAPEALGGHRKLAVTLDQNTGTVALNANDPDSGFAVLDYSSTATANGSRKATWDGGNGAGDTVNASGLGGIDLTKAGANSGLAMIIGADNTGLITLRLYTDANNYSTATVVVPNTGGAATSQVYVPFSSFTTTSGNGATLTNIGAIQLDVAANSTAADGQIDTIGAIGPTVKSQNFDNLTADLELTKTVNNNSPQVGANIVYTIGVTNVGGLNATGVTIKDVLPAGLTYVSSTATQGTYDPATGIWNVGNVEKTGTKTLQITATVANTGLKSNTAEVNSADQIDIDSTPNNNIPTEDDQSTVTLTPTVSDLSLTKTVNKTTPNVGEDVTFTVTVKNDGPNAATGVAVTDLLPSGLTFQTYASAVGTYNSTTGVWTIGNLAVGATATISIAATVTTPGTKTNTAQISAADQFDIDSTPNNNVPTEDDQASVSLTPAVADLSLTKTVNKTTPNVGEDVTFTVTVKNDGPSNATGVSVKDVLPAGLTFQTFATAAGTYNSSTGVWTVGNLATGATATLSLVVKVTTTGTKTNTAEVSAADQHDIDSTPNNNVPTEDDQASVSLTPAVADLSLTKTVNKTTPNVGEDVTFTVTVKNDGPSNATGVSVKDVLPNGLNFQNFATAAGTYNSSTGVWTVGNLATGATATLSLVAKVTTTGAKTNTAEVSAADQHDIDSTPNNNVPTEDDQASVSLTPAQADLSLAKTVDKPGVKVGESVSFSITVRNDGPSNATGVKVADSLPTGLTFQSATTSVGTFDNTTGVWTVGALNTGATATLTIVATVSVKGTFTNVAQVSAADQSDVDSTPNNNVPTEDDQASAEVTATAPAPLPPPRRFSKRLFLAR